MNTNSIHNIMNFILGAIGVAVPILVKLGCTETAAGTLDCSQASVPEWLLPWLIGIAGAIGVIKLIMNLVRDGFSGLFKQQPPVADEVKTVVVTGSANSVTEVKTVADGQVKVQ